MSSRSCTSHCLPLGWSFIDWAFLVVHASPMMAPSLTAVHRFPEPLSHCFSQGSSNKKARCHTLILCKAWRNQQDRDGVRGPVCEGRVAKPNKGSKPSSTFPKPSNYHNDVSCFFTELKTEPQPNLRTNARTDYRFTSQQCLTSILAPKCHTITTLDLRHYSPKPAL